LYREDNLDVYWLKTRYDVGSLIRDVILDEIVDKDKD
jgi:hypothetical protein